VKILHPDKKGIGSHRALLPSRDLFFFNNALNPGNVRVMDLIFNQAFLYRYTMFRASFRDFHLGAILPDQGISLIQGFPGQ
jgi:hypothetical protein